MGYATTLYAVDLGGLGAAVGSNDAGLIERARAGDASPGAVDPTKGPRVKLARDSQIFLNGRPVAWEELREIIRDPCWAGMFVYWYQENGRMEGAWSERGSFARALHGAMAGTRIAALMCCNTEEDLVDGWEDDETIPDDQAAAELVAGTFSRQDCSYGYGLERLCLVLGSRLGVIEGKARLKALKLDTPLAKSRTPIRLPEVDEFPYIGYLTAEEVRGEVARLGAMDLSYPPSAAIARDRRALLQYLETAAQAGHAVVAFYY